MSEIENDAIEKNSSEIVSDACLPEESSDIVVQPPQIQDPTDTKIPVPQFKLNTEQSFEDQAKDYVMAAATVGVVKDATTRKEVLRNKSEEVILHSKVQTKRERVEERKTEKDLQDAKGQVSQGIANKSGITENLPTWMQYILFPVLGVIQCLIYLAIGGVGSVFSITLDVINMVADRFAKLTQSAKKIFWSVFWIFIIFLGLYVISLLLARWNIFILPWQW